MPVQAFISVIMGLGLGGLLCVGGQQALNAQQRSLCASSSDRLLIYSRSFVGSAFACLEERDL